LDILEFQKKKILGTTYRNSNRKANILKIYAILARISFSIQKYSLWIDVICGHSLVESMACSTPVFQILPPYPISSHYLKPLESSGSDSIRIRRVRLYSRIIPRYSTFCMQVYLDLWIITKIKNKKLDNFCSKRHEFSDVPIEPPKNPQLFNSTEQVK
jgi:hypothetical protein